MKKVLALIACFMFIQVVGAKEEAPDIMEFLQRHSWQVGPEAYYFKYEEPGLMEEKGYFWGLTGSYIYREWIPVFPEDSSVVKWMFRADARLCWGVVDYDGALWDGTPYEYDNIKDFTGEFRLLLGLDFPKETLVDTIYTGIGHRFLEDYKSGDPAGYDRSSNYLYLPIGASTVRFLAVDWLLALTAEFDVFIRGRQSTDLRDFGYGIIHNKQNGGYGLRGSVSLEKKGKAADFIIEPFVRYWHIDDSEVDSATGGYEPANRTTEVGLDLIWRFR
jgi:hypothetical protein